MSWVRRNKKRRGREVKGDRLQYQCCFAINAHLTHCTIQQNRLTILRSIHHIWIELSLFPSVSLSIRPSINQSVHHSVSPVACLCVIRDVLSLNMHIITILSAPQDRWHCPPSICASVDPPASLNYIDLTCRPIRARRTIQWEERRRRTDLAC